MTNLQQGLPTPEQRREAFDRLGWSKARVAREAGVSYHVVKQALKGDTDTRASNLAAIDEVLGMPHCFVCVEME